MIVQYWNYEDFASVACHVVVVVVAAVVVEIDAAMQWVIGVACTARHSIELVG